jgi:hypothetical protein
MSSALSSFSAQTPSRSPNAPATLTNPNFRITGKPHLTACCSDRSHHAASDSCTAERRGPEGRASLSSKLWFSKGLSGFPDDFPGLFVVSQHNELRVTKMVCVCPFQKVYAGYGLWSKPLCRMPDYAACIWDSNSPLAILWVWS